MSDTENLAVENLAKEKYRDWDWNFGKSPEFKISKRKRYDGGELDIRINVSEGRIDEIKIYGDFLGYRGTEEIEKVLTGKRFNEKELADCIKDVDIQKYFYDIKKEDIIDCIFY